MDDTGRLTTDARWPDSWGLTWLAAVVDAASGQPAWQQRRTQRRQIARAAVWSGCAGDIALMEDIAAQLDVGVMIASQARAEYLAASDFRGRASAVGLVVAGLDCDMLLLPRVLSAGARAGSWPDPWWWDTGQGYRALFWRLERPP